MSSPVRYRSSNKKGRCPTCSRSWSSGVPGRFSAIKTPSFSSKPYRRVPAAVRKGSCVEQLKSGFFFFIILVHSIFILSPSQVVPVLICLPRDYSDSNSFILHQHQLSVPGTTNVSVCSFIQQTWLFFLIFLSSPPQKAPAFSEKQVGQVCKITLKCSVCPSLCVCV